VRLAVWRLTWALALRRRRLLAWNVIVPIMLLAPVVTSPAAPAHRAIVVAVFVAFFGAYGNCIPLIRDGMSGWVEKVRLTGYGGRWWLVERTIASAAIDWCQLVPVTLLLGLWAGTSGPQTSALLAATTVALLFANILGALIASLVRALGEAALGCAVGSLFALHAAGVFRSPEPGTIWDTIEAWSPLRPIHEEWLAALSAEGGLTWASATPPLLTLGGMLLLTMIAGDWLARRIAATGSSA
jgi:hypothetical protein